MSHKVTHLVTSKVVGSATRKSIMIYFADKASDDGRGIWASKGTIAAELELSRSTVIENIQQLIAEGLLKVAGRRSHTNGSTTEYDIDMARLRALPNTRSPKGELKDDVSTGSPKGGRTSPPAGLVRQPDQSASRTPPVRQPDTMVSASRTQTILKPSLNPAREASALSPVPCGSVAAFGWEAWLAQRAAPPLHALLQAEDFAGERVWLLPLRSPPDGTNATATRIAERWLAERLAEAAAVQGGQAA